MCNFELIMFSYYFSCLHSTNFSTLLQLSLTLREPDRKPTEISRGTLSAEVELPLGMAVKTMKSWLQYPLEIQVGFQIMMNASKNSWIR